MRGGEVGDDPVSPVVQEEGVVDRGGRWKFDRSSTYCRRLRVFTERLDGVLNDLFESSLKPPRGMRLLYQGSLGVIFDGSKAHVGEEDRRKDDGREEDQGEFDRG